MLGPIIYVPEPSCVASSKPAWLSNETPPRGSVTSNRSARGWSHARSAPRVRGRTSSFQS